MKTLMFLASLLSLPAAAAPLALSNHGHLTDGSGAPLTGSHTLVFSLYDDASATNPAVWTETHTVDFTDGDYSVVLGNGSTIDEALLEQYPLFLGLSVDANPEMTPRYEVVSAPYAILAETAANVSGGDVDAASVTTSSLEVGGSSVSPTDIASWNAAAGYGDHASAGYLTAFTETDPAFTSAPAAGITASDIASWNAAAGYGDHASAGYLTAEADPDFAASPAAGITAAQIAAWDAAAEPLASVRAILSSPNRYDRRGGSVFTIPDTVTLNNAAAGRPLELELHLPLSAQRHWYAFIDLQLDGGGWTEQARAMGGVSGLSGGYNEDSVHTVLQLPTAAESAAVVEARVRLQCFGSCILWPQTFWGTTPGTGYTLTLRQVR